MCTRKGTGGSNPSLSANFMIRFSIPRSEPAAGIRWRGVTALKGLALVFVLFYHVGGVLDWPNRMHGEVGVDIFLLISGFLLSLTATELPARDFLRKRFFRIFPAYWLALAFFVVLGAVLLHRFFTWQDILLHVVGLQATVQGAYASDIDDSFWFISTILVLYLAFLGLRRWARDPLLILGVGGLATLVTFLPFPGFDHLSGRLPGFFIGVCLGQFWRGGEFRLRPGVIFIAGVATAAALEWRGRTDLGYPAAALALAAGFLLLDRGLRPWSAGRLLLGPLDFIGLYSYEIYLFHQPLIREYNLWFQRSVLLHEPTASELVAGMAVALALTMGMALAAVAIARRRSWQIASLVLAGAALLALAAGPGPTLAKAADRLVLRIVIARAAAPQDPSLARYSGPLRLTVQLPPAGPAVLPLVVAGALGRADLLGLVRVDAQHIRLTLDHWGFYSLASADLAVTDSGPHTVDVLLGSLLPPAGSPWSAAHPEFAPLGRRLYVAVDGQEAFNREVAFHPAAPGQVLIGLNPLGGSTTAFYFTGRIQRVEPLPLDPLRREISDHKKGRPQDGP
jgi:peptidoglycan/LPS O-acetylase OafA/YrhL